MRVTILILLLVAIAAMIVVASGRRGSDSSYSFSDTGSRGSDSSFSDTGSREKTDSGTSRRATTNGESSPGRRRRPGTPDSRRRRPVTPDSRRRRPIGSPRRVDRDCRFPPFPRYGTVSVTGASVGSTAFYSCNSGFALHGNRTRKCMRDGRWSGRTPHCSKSRRRRPWYWG